MKSREIRQIKILRTSELKSTTRVHKVSIKTLAISTMVTGVKGRDANGSRRGGDQQVSRQFFSKFSREFSNSPTFSAPFCTRLLGRLFRARVTSIGVD